MKRFKNKRYKLNIINISIIIIIILSISIFSYITNNITPKIYDVVKKTGLDGIALENCVALEVIDCKMKIITSDNSKNAYKITYKNNEFTEEILE